MNIRRARCKLLHSILGCVYAKKPNKPVKYRKIVLDLVILPRTLVRLMKYKRVLNNLKRPWLLSV